MSVVICESVRKAEFVRGIMSLDDKRTILRNARKELVVGIKGDSLPKDMGLYKGYATSRSAAKRIAYLLKTGNDCFVLLFYRGKGDPIGENITIKNPAFKEALPKRIRSVLKDISEGNFELL